MTRCYFSIENRSDKTIECINHRGSDWGWRNNMTARPNNGSFEDVATMSCPSRFESDHWGKLSTSPVAIRKFLDINRLPC